MFVTGRLYCDCEAFLVRESVTMKNMKDFNYENDVVPKKIQFINKIVNINKVIVLELFTKKN